MDEKIFRMFVGNLPPDIVESDLESLIKKYGTVISVEIKRRTDGDFAFVNLKNLKTDLNTCCQTLSFKKWKGHQLRVQIARESFLERLAKERLENQKSSMKLQNAADSQNNVNTCNEWKQSVTHIDRGILNEEILEDNSNGEVESSNSMDSSSDSSDSEIPVSTYRQEKKLKQKKERVRIPMKGHLQMFLGTKTMKGKLEEESLSAKNSNHDNKITSNKIHNEREILEKFEMFNSVWKDVDSDISLENIECVPKIVKKHERRQFLSNTIESNSNFEVNSNGHQSFSMLEKIKHEEAEQRRIKALLDRKKELLKRKSIIQYALASVDSSGNASRPNKKIKFTEDGMHEESGKFSSHTGGEKLILFSDDEKESDVDNKDDFRIRDHYEGKKGKSLLELQARYGNDKRFTLDERFAESENSDEDDADKVENVDTQTERQQVLQILGNVLGKEVSAPSKTKPKHTKMMLRYDPTKPDHTKFEIKENPCPQKIKESEIKETDKSDSLDEVSESKKDSNNLPIVSKERYYQVSETLHEALQNQNQKFSLTEMFDKNASEDDEEKDEGVYLAEKPIINKRGWSLNPFKNDSSASEDEGYEQNMSYQSHDQNNVGVKQENLFFDINDARFIEGIEFIKFKNKQYFEGFEKRRPQMKQIATKKARSVQLKADKWRANFGWRKKQTSKQNKR